ncbi:MAG: DUF4416 family protein [Acidobacteriota bacterium]|nr:DUF4416 family protein [Acidobacteriota bacterium]
MVEAKPFNSVKLICGIIASEKTIFDLAEKHLIRLYGKLDHSSAFFRFDFTDYYEKQIGKNLKRKFLSFAYLYSPEMLSEIKLRTNKLEEEMNEELNAKHRIVNLDPGYLTSSALIMATAKDFSHRIPLKKGIYGHLELLFGKKTVRTLEWTYPDFRTEKYHEFFINVRKIYISQLGDKNV